MYPALQVQRDHMAQQTAKSQQAGPRRPHHTPHHHQNTVRARADRARPLPETPRKPHHPDRNPCDAGMTKALPRKPVSRPPLRDIQPNVCDYRSTGPSQQGSTRRASSVAMSQAHSRMSEMYTMIDDHLAWNMSSSDLEAARPGSSGTMFLDFDTDGEMEVSYRNGVNKKLPTPPVPAKPTLSRHTALRGEVEREVLPRKQTKRTCEVEKRKPLPPRPSSSSRHDSVISSGRLEDEKIDRHLDARPLPRVPPKDSRRTQVQDRVARRSCPPQVHKTQSTRQAPSTSASPAPSQPPMHYSPSSHHTAPTSRGRTTYIDPSGLQVRYHAPPSPSPSAAGTASKPASRAYVSGYDPATNYAYDYDGRTMHVHGSPTPSRPGSHTSEYFDISASTYRSDVGLRLVEKPLPHPPQGAARLPEPPCADAKKRHGVRRFVHKLLNKLDGLGVMKDLSSHQRHSRSSRGGGKTQTWIENGYVT
ncbi:uncharacterized protein EKO05_0010386 [Ascochyta rabiei]|nr:uncharacterized protein EKO05_0010386 [Ascochyta rabiei]UPX20144.1 hypothetical protein EKO05_0010386 [Ascochyta rabiei]